jgi:nucleoside-diphosphate-sugar epimerase
MNATKTTSPAPAGAAACPEVLRRIEAAAKTADALRLRGTIKDMDALSQEGFSRVEALARVALLALETPDAYRFPGLIAGVLETIAGIAQTTKDAASSSAADVGCGWDEFERDELRRMDAHRAARERSEQSAGSAA